MLKIRKEYANKSFDESEIPASGHPMDLFQEWFEEVVRTRKETLI